MTGTKTKRRRVLIVSFLFPLMNNIGAVRIGKFAKYLPEFGWEPIVLTADRVKGQPQTFNRNNPGTRRLTKKNLL